MTKITFLETQLIRIFWFVQRGVRLFFWLVPRRHGLLISQDNNNPNKLSFDLPLVTKFPWAAIFICEKKGIAKSKTLTTL